MAVKIKRETPPSNIYDYSPPDSLQYGQIAQDAVGNIYIVLIEVIIWQYHIVGTGCPASNNKAGLGFSSIRWLVYATKPNMLFGYERYPTRTQCRNITRYMATNTITHKETISHSHSMMFEDAPTINLKTTFQ